MNLDKNKTKRLGECLAEMKILMQEVEGILEEEIIKVPKLSKSELSQIAWRRKIRGFK